MRDHATTRPAAEDVPPAPPPRGSGGLVPPLAVPAAPDRAPSTAGPVPPAETGLPVAWFSAEVLPSADVQAAPPPSPTPAEIVAQSPVEPPPEPGTMEPGVVEPELPPPLGTVEPVTPAIPALPSLPEMPPFVPPDWPEQLARPEEPGPQDYFADARRHWITGNNVPNKLSGSERDDTLEGEEGADTLWGGAGDDILRGGTGDDVLMGGEGGGLAEGEDGDDLIFGFGRNTGGAGADTIVGGSTVSGGDGDDVLLGGYEVDGGAGDDLLIGGYDLRGGAGNDLLVGGPLATRFHLAWTSGQDTVAGYQAALDDLLLQGFARVTIRVANATDAVITFNGDDAFPAEHSVLLQGAVLPDGRLVLGDLKASSATLVLEAPLGVVQPAGAFYETPRLVLNGVEVTKESSGLNFGHYGVIFTSVMPPPWEEIVRVILPDVEIL
ncbi:MAG TPA: hypothetical protein VGN83_18170 [Falsiroseomonas sp.]|nr:hypothetical protein [Falsiroseomonas sp.]